MEYNSSLIPEAYRRHIIKMLQMRGIEPTEENIMKVATAKPKEPKKPSDLQLLATSLGSSLLQGAGSALGPQFGNWLGSNVFGNKTASTTSAITPSNIITPNTAIDAYMSAVTPSPFEPPTATTPQAGAGVLSTIMDWLK